MEGGRREKDSLQRGRGGGNEAGLHFQQRAAALQTMWVTDPRLQSRRFDSHSVFVQPAHFCSSLTASSCSQSRVWSFSQSPRLPLWFPASIPPISRSNPDFCHLTPAGPSGSLGTQGADQMSHLSTATNEAEAERL